MSTENYLPLIRVNGYDQIVDWIARRLSVSEEDGKRCAANFERNLGIDASKLLEAARRPIR